MAAGLPDAVVAPPPAAREPAPRRLEDLPGPRGLPVLGNLLQIEASRAHRIVEGWAERYGPYFQFRLGSRRFLGLGDHQAILAVLRDRPEGFRRSQRLEQATSAIGMAPGVFVSNGEAWRSQRRVVMAAFDPAHVKAYLPQLLRVAGRLESRWQAAAAKRTPIDLRADLMRFTVDAVAGLAFGAEVNTLQSEGDVIQNQLDKIFPALFKRLLAPLPCWRWLRLPADRQLSYSVAAVDTAVRGFVAAARERLRADPTRAQHPPNLLEAMIAAADAEGGPADDGQIVGNVWTMLLAGEDTTANTLAWLIWLLHEHPDALARCRDEVRRAMPDPDAATLESLGRLQWLDACISEAMRLKPVAPMMLQQALHDTNVGDVRVPAGTMIWLLLRHDTLRELYFPDASAFAPQRWLAGDVLGRDAAKRVAIPFGAGPRICPGRYLALLEMKLVMAVLLARFEIERVGTPSGAAPDEQLAVTMAPSALQMVLRPRA